MVHPDKQIRPAFRSKPAPDEPWRYVCPECKGQVHRTCETTQRYWCNGCDERYDFDDLYDKKLANREADNADEEEEYPTGASSPRKHFADS